MRTFRSAFAGRPEGLALHTTQNSGILNTYTNAEFAEDAEIAERFAATPQSGG